MALYDRKAFLTVRADSAAEAEEEFQMMNGSSITMVGGKHEITVSVDDGEPELMEDDD